MSKYRTVIATLTSIALVLAPCISFADPGNGKGKSQQNHGNLGAGKHDGGHGGPVIDRGDVLGILGGTVTTGVLGQRFLRVSRRTWRVASLCPLALQRSSMAGCWANCRVMTVTNGCRRVST